MDDPHIDEALGAASGMRMGEYCGARAVAAHGDANANFLALRDGCGIVNMTWRKRLRLTGEDRVRWLNGMVTNNIRDLAPGHGAYAFFLNPQGKIQADMYCFNRGEDLLIETDSSQVEGLKAAFEKYIIMDDVEVADGLHPMISGFIGPKAADVLAELVPGSNVHDLAPLELRIAAHNELTFEIVRLDGAVTPQFEVSMSTADGQPREDLLRIKPPQASSFAGYEAVEMLRIWSGRPRFGQDIRERDLPQETGQDRALNFTKGCYVGQEIVERIRSRGAVHRVFAGFAFESGPPQPGEKITVEGKEAGEITSSATLPGDEGPPLVALGYIRREFSKPETVVQAGSISGRVAKPPFVYVKANT
jgi:folate-binding protein YgfZ